MNLSGADLEILGSGRRRGPHCDGRRLGRLVLSRDKFWIGSENVVDRCEKRFA